ncbi:hypothetical protein GUJ93_ZPchr0003g17244 [Zizania palustris]|uniref:Uncharacterized protein n=1 Tax=Zizania palustris TaxID=103762 RepID=A0A8J5S278_ZIZPA|nr:hypothetical protein GUJ93_ZPchr0003g17244 [Zizania palustris]
MPRAEGRGFVALRERAAARDHVPTRQPIRAAPAPTQPAAEGGTSRVQARQGVELKGRSRGSVGKADGLTGPAGACHGNGIQTWAEKRDVLIGVVVRFDDGSERTVGGVVASRLDALGAHEYRPS